jgi:hypothetical protein
MTQGDWVAVAIIVVIFIVSSVAAVASTSKAARVDAALVTATMAPLDIGGPAGSTATVEVTNGGSRAIHDVAVRLDGAGDFTDHYGTATLRIIPAGRSQHWSFPVGDLHAWMEAAESISPVATWSDTADRHWRCDVHGVHRQ